MEVVEVDDWIEFILASIGERLRWLLLRWIRAGEAGDGLAGGGPVLLLAGADEDVKQFSREEKEGVGLTRGLGKGVTPRCCWFVVVTGARVFPAAGVGLLGNRLR